jgi:hypothetical protein
MLRPLGRSSAAAPKALAITVGWLGAGRAKEFVPRGRADGLRFEATDVDRVAGPGPATVRGAALAIGGALCGRRVWLDELSGDGVARLASRR